VAGIIAAAAVAAVAAVTVALSDGGGAAETVSPSPSSFPPQATAPASPEPTTPSPSPTPARRVYPQAVENSYLESCSGGDPRMREYCRCSLDEIEKKYTLEEFVDLSQRLERKEEDAQREVFGVLLGCIDKLPEGAPTPS
jgi:hypothetical protein